MKRFAQIASLTLVAGVMVLVPAGPAFAQTGNLDTEPEQQSVPITEDPAPQATLTASVMSTDAPPVAVEGAEVWYRIESGPGATLPHGPMGIGEAGCTTEADGTCEFMVDGPTTGETMTSVIRTWVEDDMIPGPATEADTGEPRDEATEDPPEPPTGDDNTDVVEVTWEGEPAPEEGLNVEPETQTLPTEDEVGEPTEATLTATVTGAEGPTEGATVAFDIEDGPNATETNGSCDTGTDGTCTFTYPSNGEEGTDTIRGWVDTDEDTQTSEADPEEGPDEATDAGTTEEPDETDVVQVVWQDEAEPPTDDCNGTKDNDVLMGTQDNDRCLGRGGDDRIVTKSGNDRARGGPGDDTLRLGKGNDRGFGGGGTDTISGGANKDDLRGGPGGGDMLRGGSHNDTLVGGGGPDDTAAGGSGKDICSAERVRACERAT